MKRMLSGLVAVLMSVDAVGAVVNANTAKLDELRTVTGVGPRLAQRIVDERARGPFRSLDDLQARVRGVGESSIRKMAAAGLTVQGESATGDAARGRVLPGAPADAAAKPGSEATQRVRPHTR